VASYLRYRINPLSVETILDASLEQKLWKTLEHIFANAIIYDNTWEGKLCG
jgi:hypothetical protein